MGQIQSSITALAGTLGTAAGVFAFSPLGKRMMEYSSVQRNINNIEKQVAAKGTDLVDASRSATLTEAQVEELRSNSKQLVDLANKGFELKPSKKTYEYLKSKRNEDAEVDKELDEVLEKIRRTEDRKIRDSAEFKAAEAAQSRLEASQAAQKAQEDIKKENIRKIYGIGEENW